jgi:hypothetical protein
MLYGSVVAALINQLLQASTETAMTLIRSSSIERKGTTGFADQSANTLPLYPMRL